MAGGITGDRHEFLFSMEITSCEKNNGKVLIKIFSICGDLWGWGFFERILLKIFKGKFKKNVTTKLNSNLNSTLNFWNLNLKSTLGQNFAFYSLANLILNKFLTKFKN